MADSLILIGKSGAMTARSSLELAGQNIANANNASYARRTLGVAEVVSTGSIGLTSSSALGGVRAVSVQRGGSTYLQAEARRTAGDLSRAETELAGLLSAEDALEQAGVYSSIVDFEASLTRLASDPLDASLRAQVLEAGNTLAQNFAVASKGLDAAAGVLQGEASGFVDRVNVLSQELARINGAIARAQEGSSGMAALYDQRDAMLKEMSGYLDVATQFDSQGRVTVSAGGAELVSGTQSASMAVAQNADGTLGLSVGGSAIDITSGALAGEEQALQTIAGLRGSLDTLAVTVMEGLNASQANGSDIEGNAGQPFFSGTGAADMKVVLSGGAGLATAPAGAEANSRDVSNLTALQQAFAQGGPASVADGLLLGLSAAISGKQVTRDALAAIADSAEANLSAETGVDLDQEAANLLRYQQAFQASSRVIQVASDIFDTLLGIR